MEPDDTYIFGIEFWREFVESLDLGLDTGFQELKLNFETEKHAFMELRYEAKIKNVSIDLPLFGILPIKNLFDLPHVAQEVTIIAAEYEWTIFRYMFVLERAEVEKLEPFITEQRIQMVAHHGENV